MTLIVKNLSSDPLVLSGDVTIGATAETEIPPLYWPFVFSNLEFISNIRNNNFTLNDGANDYRYPDSEKLLSDLIANLNTAESIGNSTTAVLLAGQSFIGSAEDALSFGSVSISVYSDKIGSFRIQTSSDKVTWRNYDDAYNITPNMLKTVTHEPKVKYLRLLYKNGPENQTTFTIQTTYKKMSSSPTIQPVSITLADDGLSVIVKAHSFTANANTTTVSDFLLSEAFLFKGIRFISANATVGDYIRIDLIDKDNVLGFGANTVIRTPIEKAYIQSTANSGPLEADDVSASELPASGLYLRISYTNTALLNAVNAYLNFILYRRG